MSTMDTDKLPALVQSLLQELYDNIYDLGVHATTIHRVGQHQLQIPITARRDSKVS